MLEHSLGTLCRAGVISVLLGRALSTGVQHYAAAATSIAKTHYVVLGITPAATQADIKSAYYKLSKVYHPDRQSGIDDAEAQARNLHMFREVTVAYEVLGNVKLRKLYDKGMTHVGSDAPRGPTWKSPVDDDPSLKFYRSREVKSRPPPTANSPLYDFDEWSKQHYGATFARDQFVKRKQQQRAAAMRARVDDVKIERVLIAIGAFVLSIAIITRDMRNHDEPRVTATPPPATREETPLLD